MAEKFRRRKSISGHLFDITLVTVIGTLISFLFILDHFTLSNIINNVIYSALIGSTLWKGNELVAFLIEDIWGKNKTPGRVLTTNIIGMALFSLADIFLVNYFWVVVLMKGNFWFFFTRQGGYWIFIIQMMVTCIIALTIFTKSYFRAWRESVRGEEELKRETLALQFEALKNQVNPHFLFNSLNALSSLVTVDHDKAVKFIKQLSEVYRYVLEQKDKETVGLLTELKFVDSYIFLQKMRFQDNLIFNKNISEKSSKLSVIPLSIQILVENAIKHNIISGENPLTIDIFTENGCLVVRNNLQKKRVVEKSSQIGLTNLKARYEYLTSKQFYIVDDGSYFLVRIPLIYAEQED